MAQHEDDSKTAEQLFGEAFRSLENASSEPLRKIQAGTRLIVDALARHSREVEMEQSRIQEKLKRGSRLRSHRYTS